MVSCRLNLADLAISGASWDCWTTTSSCHRPLEDVAPGALMCLIDPPTSLNWVAGSVCAARREALNRPRGIDDRLVCVWPGLVTVPDAQNGAPGIQQQSADVGAVLSKLSGHDRCSQFGRRGVALGL